MERLKSITAMICLGISLTMISGCGDTNIFGWTHSPGSSSTVASLSSDAYTALQNKDYAKAMEYYSKVLEQDPNNSEAIYGYSAAKLADSGLDIASLIANLLTASSSSSSSSLAPSLETIAHSASSTDNIIPQTILDRAVQIKAAIEDVLGSEKLKRIIQGRTDGRISPENADVNINVAFALVLRAALRVKDLGVFKQDYSTGITTDNDDVRNAIKDLVSAYKRLEVVYVALKLDSNSTVAKIRDDIEKLYKDLYANATNAVSLSTDWYKDSSY